MSTRGPGLRRWAEGASLTGVSDATGRPQYLELYQVLSSALPTGSGRNPSECERQRERERERENLEAASSMRILAA